MTQPCGSVCGLPGRYRTYLRSSPTLCLADSISILLRLIIISACLKVSPFESLQVLLDERFSDAEDDDPQGGFRSLERLTWLRWLFFILGTLPPTIKLASMGGVPWTKTLGMIYLTSFLVVETLVIVSTRRSNIPQHHIARSRTPQAEYVRKAFTEVDKVLAILAFSAQFGLFYWVQAKTSFTALYTVFGSDYYLSYYAIALRTFCPFTIYFRLLRTVSDGYVGTFRCFCGIFFLIDAVFYAFIEKLSPYVSAPTIFLQELYIVLSTAVIVDTILYQFRMSLLMSDRQRSNLSDDRWTLFTCFMFFSNIFYALLGYAYVYDPTETFNPAWTGIFG